MTTNELPKPAEVAKKFSTILREWLTPKQIDHVNCQNILREILAERLEGKTDNICHSHDYCDANMAMLEAMQSFGFDCDEIIHDEQKTALWNEAWNIAKAARFNPKRFK